MRYEITTRIARGGMGAVYLGHLRGAAGFHRRVAIKRASSELRGAEAREMILAEARNASRVRHPNVVSIDDVDESDDGELLLVMEYVEGGSLFDLLAKGVLAVPVAVRIALDIAMGLSAIHTATDDDGNSLSLVHRDVSPHNVLVGLDGIARVTDFGLAKSVHDPKKTAASVRKGKLSFMAPEYLRTGAALPSGDMFAFGAIVWEMLSGERLFRETEEQGAIEKILTGEVPHLTHVPPAIAAIVDRSLADAPQHRFPSMSVLAAALERDAAGEIASRAEVAAMVASRAGALVAARREAFGSGTDLDVDDSDAIEVGTGDLLTVSYADVRTAPPPAQRGHLHRKFVLPDTTVAAPLAATRTALGT